MVQVPGAASGRVMGADEGVGEAVRVAGNVGRCVRARGGCAVVLGGAREFLRLKLFTFSISITSFKLSLSCLQLIYFRYFFFFCKLI